METLYPNKTILLVEDETDVRDVVRMTIEVTFSCKVIEAENASEAIEALSKHGEGIDLVISDHNMPGGADGSAVLKHIESSGLQTPFVLMSAYEPKGEYDSPFVVANIEKPCIIEPLEAIISKVFSRGVAVSSTSADSSENSIEETAPTLGNEREFIPVSLSMILRMDSLKYDLYLRLSDEKFVKVANAGDDFDVLDAKHFLQKKITELFMRYADANRFIHDLNQLLVYITEDQNSLSNEEDDIEISISSHAFIAKASKLFGFSDEIIEITNRSVNLAIRAAKKNKEISKLINQKFADPNSYLSSHSMMIAYISCGLAQQLEWSSKFTYVKLSLAAVFHDLALEVEDPEKIRELQELACSPGSKATKELKKFRKHPAKSAELLAKMKQIPPDVECIILQHEERPDGTGFPHRLTHQRLNPLSALFILTEDLVDFLFENGHSIDDLGAFLEEKEDLYSRGHFRKILELLLDSDINNGGKNDRLIA